MKRWGLPLALLILSVQVLSINFIWATELRPQEITFKMPDSLSLMNSPYEFSATSSSGLQAQILSTSPLVCEVVKSTLLLKSMGDCVLVATEPGDSTYAAAPKITKKVKVVDFPQIDQPISTKIVGGESILISEAPWQVALISSNASSNFGGQFCGGSIIDSRWILTAAHCLVKNNTVSDIRSFGVLVGSASLSTLSLSALNSVAEIIVHPNWNSNTLDSDIALIRLVQPLNFIANAIQPISINQSELVAGRGALISGWGNTAQQPSWNPINSYPSQLQGGIVYARSNASCLSYFAIFNSQKMLCAGATVNGYFEVDACDGDSGGPLAIFDNNQWKLAGLTSFGRGCAWNDPSVYTKVSYFAPWISSNIGTVQAPLTIANTVLTGTVGTPITLSTSGGSGSGAVSYATTGTGCSISTTTLSATAATTCVVTATKAASTGFLVATSATKSFTLTLSISRANAVRAAASYLRSSAFSRSGLIKQLLFEGYSNDDVIYAVDAQQADWRANAVRAAASYLRSSAFSRSGLIKQLLFEGYSNDDVVYAVDAQKADWRANAVRAAASYLRSSAFSRSGLIKQLLFEGYSQDDAEFAVTSAGL